MVLYRKVELVALKKSNAELNDSRKEKAKPTNQGQLRCIKKASVVLRAQFLIAFGLINSSYQEAAYQTK